MYSYDWITLVTLGLDRWQQQRNRKPGYQIELEEVEARHRLQHQGKIKKLTPPTAVLPRAPTASKTC